MPEQSISNTLKFSISHTTAFLHLGTLDSLSAPHLGAILDNKITNKKHKNAKKPPKKHGTKQTMKRTSVYNVRAKARRQRLVSPQMGTCVSGDSIFFATL